MKFNVLHPRYIRLGNHNARPSPSDEFAVSWDIVGQAVDMEDAKRLICRPVLERIPTAPGS